MRRLIIVGIGYAKVSFKEITNKSVLQQNLINTHCLIFFLGDAEI